jgi:malonyl-CoA/methylmalonyl-CoA synthetase
MYISEMPLVARAETHQDRVAIIAADGTFTYRELLGYSGAVASCLLQGADDLEQARVAFLTPPGFAYAAVQWGIWRAGGVAVPMAVSHPKRELEHVVDDCGATVLMAHPDCEAILRPLAQERGLRFLLTPQALGSTQAQLPPVSVERSAMIVYTSGTTSRPKGVVTTHRSIQAQVTSLVQAWEWAPDDHILNVLPLHHIHGIINVLTCALWSGALCEILPRFDAGAVWDRMTSGDLTLFMGVPTTYTRLISAWEAASAEQQRAMSGGCARLRLMVSGSAALSVQTQQRWKAISGHVLLERYGMTEIGMALSNPLHGQRRPGHVGIPLPGVELRLVDEESGQPVEPGTPGEIQVKGVAVFQEYWNNPEATASSFCGGWFRTGDIAVLEDGHYRILGRNSVDIIKTGGFKVSALEVEEVLNDHPDIEECAVVGAEDAEWGERVCAVLVLRVGHTLTLEFLRTWAGERLAPYKIPTRMLTLERLPRNAMDKVTKPELMRRFQAQTGM